MRSEITCYNIIDKYYVINPYKLGEESEEYDLYLELFNGVIGRSRVRLRDIPSILTKRQKSRVWSRLIYKKRSFISSKKIPGYLNAYKYIGNRTWYLVM